VIPAAAGSTTFPDSFQHWPIPKGFRSGARGRAVENNVALAPNPPWNPHVPQGTPLNFMNPTFFTGAALIRLCLRFAHPDASRGDPVIATSPLPISRRTSKVRWSTAHFPVPFLDVSEPGRSRELAPNFVVSADFVYRRFMISATDLACFRHQSLPSAPRPNTPQLHCAPGRSEGSVLVLGPIFAFHGHWKPKYERFTGAR